MWENLSRLPEYLAPAREIKGIIFDSKSTNSKKLIIFMAGNTGLCKYGVGLYKMQWETI